MVDIQKNLQFIINVSDLRAKSFVVFSK